MKSWVRILPSAAVLTSAAVSGRDGESSGLEMAATLEVWASASEGWDRLNGISRIFPLWGNNFLNMQKLISLRFIQRYTEITLMVNAQEIQARYTEQMAAQWRFV